MSTNLSISTLSPNALRSLTSSSRKSNTGGPQKVGSFNELSVSITSSNSRLQCDCAMDALNKENKKLIEENNMIRQCLMLTKENSELKTVNFIMSAMASCDDKLQKFMRDVLFNYQQRGELNNDDQSPSASRSRSILSGRETPSYGRTFEDVRLSDLLGGTARDVTVTDNGATVTCSCGRQKTLAPEQVSPTSSATISADKSQKGSLKINILGDKSIRVEKETGTGENPVVTIRSNVSTGPRFQVTATPSPSNVDNSTYTLRVTPQYRNSTPSPSNVDNSTYEMRDDGAKTDETIGQPAATSTPLRAYGNRRTYTKVNDESVHTNSLTVPSRAQSNRSPSPFPRYAKTNGSPISVGTPSPRPGSTESPYKETPLAPYRRTVSPSPKNLLSPNSASTGSRYKCDSRSDSPPFHVLNSTSLNQSERPASYVNTTPTNTSPRSTLASGRYTPSRSPRQLSATASSRHGSASRTSAVHSSYTPSPKSFAGSGSYKKRDTYLSPTYVPRNTVSKLASSNSSSPKPYIELTPKGLSSPKDMSTNVAITITPPTPSPSGLNGTFNASPREMLTINSRLEMHSEEPNSTGSNSASFSDGGRVMVKLRDLSAPESSTKSPEVSIEISSALGDPEVTEDALAAVIGFEGEGAVEKVNAVLYRPVDQLTGYKPNVTVDTANALAVARPTRRLVGEIAFQLEHRILVFVFSAPRQDGSQRKSNRFYGYCLANIMQMITREATHGSYLNSVLEDELRDRLYTILRQLHPFGFSLDLHAEFSQDIINRYGLLNITPEQTTVDGFSLNDPGVLRLLLGRIFHSERLLHDMLMLLDCLYYLSQEDHKPLFMW